MSFDLNVFATEFGIDPATLQAKPDAFKKWNGYLSEADTQYKTAKQLKDEAQATLDAVKAEQAVIDDRIANYSLSEAEVDTLRANYASLEATVKTLQDAGYKGLKIPEPVKKNEPAAFDPNRFQQDVNGTLVAGFNVMNRYQRLYGKALPDDLDALAREAKSRNINFTDYVAQKYDFAGEEKRQSQAASQKEKDEYAALKVKEYQEAHPVTAGNPELLSSGASRFPELAKRPTPKAHENYGGSPAQRIARSVKRSMEGLAAVAS
jgi:hypothetical protein